MSSEALSSLVLNNRVSENAALERVLVSGLHSVLNRTIEGLRLECVGAALVLLTTWTGGRCLHSARVGALVTENIRILVGGASDLGLKRLVSEEVVSLLLKLLCLVPVWLMVEGCALVGVVVASAPVVVHYVVVGMAQHICAVLTLFQVSCFGHLLLTYELQ